MTDITGKRVLLLVPAITYRATDFVAAAQRLGLDVVIGSDGALPLGGQPVVRVDPNDPGASGVGHRRINAGAKINEIKLALGKNANARNHK